MITKFGSKGLFFRKKKDHKGLFLEKKGPQKNYKNIFKITLKKYF